MPAMPMVIDAMKVVNSSLNSVLKEISYQSQPMLKLGSVISKI